MKNLIIAILCSLSLPLARAPIKHNQFTVDTNSLSEFQSVSTIFSGTGGTSTADLANPWAGAQSNKFTIGNASTVIFQQAFSAKNICADSFVRVVVRFPNKLNVSNLARIDVYILSDFANFKSAEVWGAYALNDTIYNYWGQWQTLHFPIRQFATTGTFNCANVTSIALGLRANASTQDTLSVAQISTYPHRLQKAVLLLTVDDNYESFRQNGSTVLDSACLDYTMFINPDLLGTATKSSRNQIDSMFFKSRCSRPDIAPHTMRHDYIYNMSTDSLVRDIRACIKYIRDQGWCRTGQCCTDCFALPFGAKHRPSDSAIRASGLISWSRLSKGGPVNGESQIWDDPINVRSIMATGNLTDTTVAKAIIDTLILYKNIGAVIVHKIEAAGCTEDINTWCKPKWDAFIRHVRSKVAAGTLEVLSVGDAMQQYGGGFSPSRRSGIGGR